MKLKTVLAAFAAMVSLGVNAQDWTASPVGAGTFMLYNVGAGQFFTKGNNWGTQASIASEGLAVELVLVGNDVQIRAEGNNTFYGVEYLDSKTVFVDQSRNKVSTWQFIIVGTESDPVYNIVSADSHGGGAGTYLTAEGGSSTVVGGGSDGKSDFAKWKLKVVTDFEATRAAIIATMDAATLESPVDVTGLIGDANFDSSALPIYWAMASSNKNLCGGASSNRCAESYKQPFTLTQTLFVPNGKYELTAQAATNGNLGAYIYANDKTSSFVAMTEGEGSMNTVSASFTDGKYYVDPITVIVTDGKLTIGAKTDRNDSWYIWDNFQLKYYGIDLSALKDNLAEKVAAAAALENTIPTAAYTALNNVVTEYNKTYTTAEAYETAIGKIEEAVTSAKNLVDPYAAYKLIPADATFAGVAAATIEAQNNAVEEATDVAGIEACSTALKAAIDALAFDITSFTITNASPYANGDGWTATNGTRLDVWASNPVTYDSDNQCAEMWNNTGASMLYTITNLPAGRYRLTAIAGAREGKGCVLKAGDKTIELVSVGTVNNRAGAKTWFDNGNGVNELYFTLDNTTAELTIGLVAGASGDAWTIWRSFKLESFTETVAYDETKDNTIADANDANVIITRTIQEGYNTVVLPFTLTDEQVTKAFGAGTEVYVYSENSAEADDVTITFTKGDGSISANVPVLVKATAASNAQVFEGVQVVAPTTDVKVAGTNFDFIGVYAAGKVAEGDFFFAKQDDKAKVVKSKGDNNTINAFRAYFDNKGGVSSVKLFIEGIATRISDINGAAENGAIFNLAGQRVNKAQKGIFIQNGKKVILK